MRIFFVAILSLFMATPAVAELSKSEVETLIRDTLLNNPEIVVEALTKYQIEETARLEAQAAQLLKESQNALVNDPDSPSIGPKNASVIIVKFFDYNCGYCKRQTNELVQLIAQDKDVRIVFKEIPILRESSHIAARISHAVNQLAPEKYWDFHTKAMQYPGSASEANYLNVAESVGLDRTKVKAKMSDPKINGIIQRDLALAQKLNIRGTPAMIIDGKLSPGYIRLNQIKSQIDAARRG